MADPASDQNNEPTSNSTEKSLSGGSWSPPAPDWSEPPVTNPPLMSTVPVEPTPPETPPTQPTPSPGGVTPAQITPEPSMPASTATSVEAPTSAQQTVPEPPVPTSSQTASAVPPLTLSPQEDTMTLGQPQSTSPPRKGGGGKKFLIIFLILIILGVLVVVGYFVLNQTLLKRTSVTVPESSPQASASAQAVPLTRSPDLLYLKAGNVFRYSTATNTESQITNDGGPQVSYRLPKWFDENMISLIRCGDKSEDGKKAYICILLRQQIDGSTPVELAKLSSKPNENGFQEGDIELYAWDKNKVQLAYVTRETATGSAGLYKLHYQESSESAARVLKEIPAGGGRGGSLDDTTHLEFSPDGNRLLLNLTTLYPVSDDDQGTLFVYDLPSKQQIWALPKTWTTFAHWLSGNIIIAKQQSTDESASGGQWQLVRIDLTKAASDPKAAVESIVEVPTWFGIEPLSPDTLVFSELQESTGSGVLLSRMTLSTKAKKTLKENILKLEVVDEKTLLARSMKPCSPDCGTFDFYNGVTDDQTGLFDVASSNFIPFKIATDSGQPFDFDIR